MNDKNLEEENFADMLESSLSGIVSYEPGQLIEAEIVSISGGCVFMQLDGKSEGQIDSEELMDKNGNLDVKVGDSIKAYFQSSDNGDMIFTTKISGDKAGKAALENAYRSGIPVEGLVEKEIKGGYEIKIGDTKAFCPFSQIGLKRVEDASVNVGKNFTFKILEYKENGRNILVSSRALLEEAKQVKIEELKQSLKVGMKVTGIVKSLQKFGAFVDLNGVQALLPISEISRVRIEDISQILTLEQEVEVEVLNLDWEKERISVSMKQLMSDPWDDAATKYRSGTVHKGKVARMTTFGAFVTLEPGLDGLVHISDIESDARDNEESEEIKKGQILNVRINSLDTERKRISLKLISNSQEAEAFQKYMEPESDTYNPFAALLKDKVKKPAKKK